MLLSPKCHARYWLLYEKRQKHDEMVECLYLTFTLYCFAVNSNSKIWKSTVYMHLDTPQFHNELEELSDFALPHRSVRLEDGSNFVKDCNDMRQI